MKARSRKLLTLCVCLSLLAMVVLFFVLPLLYRNDFLIGGREDLASIIRPAERRITILAVNDIYRLDGVSEGRRGGLARVRTLRKLIEKDDPNVILLHAGDFLSPSLISGVYKGRQMIDVMNNLDGDPLAFDTRMFVVFGNHEFDVSRCDKLLAPLNARVDESQFTWLVANLDFTQCSSMEGMLERRNVKKDGVVLSVNSVRVGLFGIGLTTPEELDATKNKNAPDAGKSKREYPPLEDVFSAAERSIRDLRKRGAEFVVGITHLPKEWDAKLIRAFASKGLDLLIGGHDHSAMVLRQDDGAPRGFKADSDARTAWRLDVRFKNQKPQIDARLIELDEGLEPDRVVGKLATAWSERADAALCAKRARTRREPYDPKCLSKVIGWTKSTIELEENANRSRETGIGDWLADLLLRKTKADVAIVNSGNLGLGEDLEPGTDLTLKHVIDMFRYDDVVAVWEFPADEVCRAISHGFGQPGLGAWPHVGGVEVDIKTSPDGKTEEATVRRFTNQPNIDCGDHTAKIKVASVPFVFCGGEYPLTAALQDCFKTVQDKQRDDPPGEIKPGQTLSDVTEQEIREAQARGIKPEKDGRVRSIK